MAALSATCCAYCGLPVPRAWRAGNAGADEAAYCCAGCRFAAAVAGAAEGDRADARWMFTRLGLAIFCTMNVMAFTMALWSTDVYGGGSASETALVGPLHGLFRYLCLFFAVPVLCWLGGPLLENAWHTLRRGQLTTDLLLVLGVGASYVYSAVSVLRDEGPVYFEVGCVVLVLVTLGRWLEATGRARATQALENLERLLPEQVRVLAAAGEIEKRRGDVQVGERLRVRAGERVPCDGVVLGHAAAVDEQLLTGESGGRVKEPGERVHAGTLNLDSDLILEVCSEPEAGALSRIVRLIRQARQQQGQYEQLADRVTAWLLPLVTIIALGAAAWHGYRLGIDHGLLAGLAVLLIACPCALGIATPLALWVAQGEAAAHHVLFQSNEALERLARVDHLCFDKTGTLTTGQCTVSAIHCDDDAARRRTLALTAASNHTHAQALAAALRQGGTVLEEVATHLQTLPGRGLVADWQPDGERVLLGSLRLMRENTQLVPQGLAGAVAAAFAGGQPLVCIGWGGFVRGVFVLQEELRPEAKAALAQLQELGIEVSVLTGDHGQRGAVLARELGVSVAAELLPEDKVAKLQELRRAGRIVAMVGDGINDGPALAASDVGIALGCGADVARDSAGVCLLNNDLARLPWAIALARRAVWVVRENLFWAFAYNVAGIALAATGLLNPVLAALAMLLSSVLVLANSLRLRSATPTPVIESDACSIVS